MDIINEDQALQGGEETVAVALQREFPHKSSKGTATEIKARLEEFHRELGYPIELKMIKGTQIACPDCKPFKVCLSYADPKNRTSGSKMKIAKTSEYVHSCGIGKAKVRHRDAREDDDPATKRQRLAQVGSFRSPLHHASSSDASFDRLNDNTPEWTEPEKLTNNGDETGSQASATGICANEVMDRLASHCNENDSPQPLGTAFIGGECDDSSKTDVVGRKPAANREEIGEASGERPHGLAFKIPVQNFDISPTLSPDSLLQIAQDGGVVTKKHFFEVSSHSPVQEIEVVECTTTRPFRGQIGSESCSMVADRPRCREALATDLQGSCRHLRRWGHERRGPSTS